MGELWQGSEEGTGKSVRWEDVREVRSMFENVLDTMSRQMAGPDERSPNGIRP